MCMCYTTCKRECHSHQMREAVGQIFRIDGRAKKGHGGDDGGEGHDLAHVVRAFACDTCGKGNACYTALL